MKLQEILMLTHEEVANNKPNKTELDHFKHKDKMRQYKGMGDHAALLHTAKKTDEFYEIMSQKMYGHYTAEEIKVVANFFWDVKANRLGEKAGSKQSRE